MKVVGVVEDPGASNGMIGLADALMAKGCNFELYASGTAVIYAAGIGLEVCGLETLQRPNEANAVVVGTSENPESPVFEITRQATNAGIPVFGFIDGPANAQHRFRGLSDDPLTHAPEFLLVSDTAARDAFVALGVAGNNIEVVGHPGMDRVRALASELATEGKAAVRARLFPEINATRPLVLFLAETSDGLEPTAFRRSDAYTLFGRGRSDRRTEICLEETIDALTAVAPDAALALRLHPKNDASDFAPYAAEIDALSFGGDPLEAVFASDLVIGMTSVLLFEAAIMGCSTLSVTPRACETQWLSSIALGLTHHVCTSDALATSISVGLAGELQAANDVDTLVPSGAAKRIAAAICRRIKG